MAGELTGRERQRDCTEDTGSESRKFNMAGRDREREKKEAEERRRIEECG